jgi:hypothetical protein
MKPIALLSIIITFCVGAACVVERTEAAFQPDLLPSDL